jgi:hypothetical protein
LWCVDAVTKEKDGVGLVHGGAPVKLARILADLKGADRESIRRHLEKLAKAGYLRTKRTPYGQTIEVLNSKKFNIWRKEKPQKTVSQPPEEKPQKAVSRPEEKPLFEAEKPQIAVSKEDSAQDLRKLSLDVERSLSDFSSSSEGANRKTDDDKIRIDTSIAKTQNNQNSTSLKEEAADLIRKKHPFAAKFGTDSLSYFLNVAENHAKRRPISPNFYVTSFENECSDFIEYEKKNAIKPEEQP